MKNKYRAILSPFIFLMSLMSAHNGIIHIPIECWYSGPAGLLSLPTRTYCHYRDYAGKFYRDDNGKLHRDNDLPAVIYPDGTQEWWQHGKLHRDGDFPSIIRANGTQEWYQYGKRHRDTDDVDPAFTGSGFIWSIDDNILTDIQVIARIQKRILSFNAKKIELLAIVALCLPLDMGMNICHYV